MFTGELDDDKLFFSLSQLLVLYKSDRRNEYVTKGFYFEDLVDEVNALAEKAYKQFKMLSVEDYTGIIEASSEKLKDTVKLLVKEGYLMSSTQPTKIYFTKAGVQIMEFFAKTSENFYIKKAIKNTLAPFRFYPDSEDVYGLN